MRISAIVDAHFSLIVDEIGYLPVGSGGAACCSSSWYLLPEHLRNRTAL